MDSAVPELRMVEGRSLDPSAGATAVAYDPTQDIIAVGRATGVIDMFSARHTTSSRMHSGQDSAIEHLIFVAGEAALAAINSQGQLLVFDLDTLAFCFAYSVPIAPTCVALFPGTSWLLVGTEAGRVYFVDAVAGRKANFSVDCLVKPVSSVAAVEPHPIESERFLIAYADGNCVVCDLGKASVSSRAMVLSRHKFDHPTTLKQRLSPGPGSDIPAETIEPWLLSAGWSPTGERLVASYSNGVLCIFGANSGTAPLVARTIQCSDILSANSETIAAATGMDRKMRNLQHVRWCTHEKLDQSFLIVTSGSTSSFQSYIHVFGTKTSDANVKSSRDVTALECYGLRAPLTGLCTIPSVSPWRSGRDGVRSLAILSGRPTQVSLLEITASMRLRQSEKLLGELEWCSGPAELICRAEGRLNTALGKLLAGTLSYCISEGTDSAYAGSPDIDTLSQTIKQLFCCANSSGMISLWCIADQRLQCCKSVELDLQYLSRLLGIEGRILFMSLCSLSGLLAIGMDSGEVIICMLTEDKQAPLAQSYTPLEKLREQASTYYNTGPPAVEAHSTREDESQPSGAPSPCSGARPHSTQVYSTKDEKQTSGVQRERSVSIADGNLVRRGSKRLSSTFGTLFRRGSVARENSSRSKKADAKSGAALNGIYEASIENIKAASDKYSSTSLGNLSQVDMGAWKEQTHRLNIEMSQMLYGLQLDPTEHQGIYHEKQLNDSNASASADATPIPRPYVVPYLLARFYKCAISGITSSLDGLVAITYEGGALVVIDAVNQRTLLADNINRVPGTTLSTKDMFCNSRFDVANAPKQISTVTYVAFAVVSNQGQRQQTLLAGTSTGAIIRYFIHSSDSPPIIVAKVPGGPIHYLCLEDLPESEMALGTSEENCLQPRQLLVAASESTISLYPWLHTKPAAAYILPDDTARLVDVHVISESSGWRGVAAIDSNANITFLSLPQLTKAAHFALPGNLKKLLSSAHTVLAGDGQILMLGTNGHLLQAQITSKSATLLDGDSNNLGESYFNPDIALPPLPVRKSITSWLLGKALDPRSDIDKFLSSHFKDLLRDGGTRPGLRLHREPTASEPVEPDTPSAAAAGCSRQDSKIEEIGRSVEAGQFGTMKDMAEMRGQQLDAAAEATESLNIQSQNFLKNIRAYNAKQKKRDKKHFGLF
ncbi:Lethal(2) giant larvae sro7 [Coemansia guatemalensis]|uniref:Lethal(2) giant larvae sro7 n=1 Tax=Coemansia guatemalensis TaxID=2761395 RepID=A0A9W8LSU5_9FUNG|nr:Lethal(2) giant larvae sro7 [Coemansia guatemalensis]